MIQSPLQKRAERRDRNKTSLDMNLVSLIDIFTLLIFFLLSNTAAVEVLPSSKVVRLPESTSDKAPKETVVLVVNNKDILVQGRKIASVAEVMASEGDVIAPLKAELDERAKVQTIRRENEAQSKAITIMGDKDISYRLLRKVMVTCARANFSEVSFAVSPKHDAG
jgi:biopolymer transport protein TolR